MEGILSLWTNVLVGWKPKYFILHDNALIFCDQKGGKKKGSVHLKIATISNTPDDPLRIIINTGTAEMHLKAGSIPEKVSWTNALKDAHEEAKQKDLRKKQDSLTNGSSLTSKSRMLADTKSNMFNDRLSQLASLQTEFDESLKLFVQKVGKINGLKDLAGKLDNIGVDMKQRVSACINEIEDEKASMLTVIDYLDAKKGGRASLHPEDRLINYDKYEEKLNGRKSYGTPLRNSPGFENNHNEGQIEVDEDEESFYSFELEDGYLHMPGGYVYEEEEEKKHGGGEADRYHNNNRFELRPKSNSGASLNELSLTIPKTMGSKIGEMHEYHPIIKTMLETNDVFKNFQIPSTITRDKLPHLIDPNQKLPIWKFLKDMIGKDLSRFTMPVWMNEPLSMLQRLCEQIEHVYLLEKASTFPDSCLRLAYVCAFSITPYSNTATRHKKPFNPLLGETFEYIPPDKSFRFIGEQVSHHPPISAGFADSPLFQLWSDSNVKSGIKGTTMEVRPLGSTHATLKKWNDHYTFRRPVTTVGGLIFGSVYVDNHGEVTVTNHSTKDVAVMILKKRGWTDAGMGDITGTIKDASGKVRYKIVGNCNKDFRIIDEQTKQESLIWEKTPLPPDYAKMFGFNKFAIQLNHLSKDMLHYIAPTDSRMRPDQRAYELGMSDLAATEKHRLEEKQRARRKVYQTSGKIHEPRWFKEINDPITNEKGYSYNGGYWESRDKQHFDDMLDIYTNNPV